MTDMRQIVILDRQGKPTGGTQWVAQVKRKLLFAGTKAALQRKVDRRQNKTSRASDGSWPK